MYVTSHDAGYELLWEFDVHSGAGIDQIWWNKDTSNPRYLIVEAKGPTAGLSHGALGNPPGYEQMEKLWVVDRLGRMRNGVGQQIANGILNALALDITIAHPFWGGGSRSYYGCAARKQGVATGTVCGLTLTAKWCADGMLDAKAKVHATRSREPRTPGGGGHAGCKSCRADGSLRNPSDRQESGADARRHQCRWSSHTSSPCAFSSISVPSNALNALRPRFQPWA